MFHAGEVHCIKIRGFCHAGTTILIDAFLIDPRRAAVRGNNGDLAVAVFGADDLRNLPEHILFLQRFDQRALKFMLKRKRSAIPRILVLK